LIACNALIAAIFAGLTSFIVYYLNSHRTSLISLSRGSVAGIVAISAVAN
jgi:ammonia channel protein AmtB